jgi:hypothetical protein
MHERIANIFRKNICRVQEQNRPYRLRGGLLGLWEMDFLGEREKLTEHSHCLFFKPRRYSVDDSGLNVPLETSVYKKQRLIFITFATHIFRTAKQFSFMKIAIV